jgi:hypothetical protein
MVDVKPLEGESSADTVGGYGEEEEVDLAVGHPCRLTF